MTHWTIKQGKNWLSELPWIHRQQKDITKLNRKYVKKYYIIVIYYKVLKELENQIFVNFCPKNGGENSLFLALILHKH